MSGEAKKLVSQVSAEDLDSWTRTSTFSHEVEESVRGHIHEELRSWITFRKLAADCASANVALHGFAQLWENSAKECLQDAHWLERYLINRGGRSNPTPIEPHPVEWPAQPVEPVQPCKEAFNTEKRLLDDLQRLANLAATAGDVALADAIQCKLIWKESKHVKDLGDLLQQVVRVSKVPGLGIYLLDRELRENGGCVPWGGANDLDCVQMNLELENRP